MTMHTNHPARGFSLVELLVAMAIGLLLISAAITAYVRSRALFETDETLARLQDTARFALATMEPDIELAGYYGASNRGANLSFVAHGASQTLVATAYGMRQSADSPVTAIGAAAHACGRNFAIDVMRVAEGANNHFAVGPNATSACAPYSPGAQPGADVLTLRRASVDTSAAADGRIQILASRLSSLSRQFLFVDGRAPVPPDADHEIHDLNVRVYYVAQSSVDHARYPALRVKSLTSVAGEPAFTDAEIVPGVEDLQIEFGIDSAAHSGQVSQYVNPDYPGLEAQQIVAVRAWIRVRAEHPEPGFIDAREYHYADVSFVPVGAERTLRRVLLSRTITLRNARTS